MPESGEERREGLEVLPIDTLGGAGVTIDRTFELVFSLSI